MVKAKKTQPLKLTEDQGNFDETFSILFPISYMDQVKLRYYEKATKFEKKIHLCIVTKHLFLLSSVKTVGRFFQIFVAFSEKMDFKALIVQILNSCFLIGWPFKNELIA